MNLAFYLTAAVAVLATIMVVTRANAIHALLYMIVSLLAVALIFFLLGAPFVAALEVVVYAGAIMVLFVFVVMMLNLGPKATEQELEWLQVESWWGPAILAGILIIELGFLLTRGGSLEVGSPVEPVTVSTSLFGPYLIGVELASILLLAGLVGAYHLGRGKEPDRDQGQVKGGEE